MTPSTNRRHLLKLASAAASTLWLPRSAWSQARFSGNPFALGVASGSPTHDSLVLWTPPPTWPARLAQGLVLARLGLGCCLRLSPLLQPSQALHPVQCAAFQRGQRLSPLRELVARYTALGRLTLAKELGALLSAESWALAPLAGFSAALLLLRRLTRPS